jgi:XTP/dITP diphosphohydrolase
MLKISRLVLASNNPGKLIELREILGDLGIELIPQAELGIPEADETGTTFVENAILKARQAAERSGLPALADDSGLCVDALGGAPGLISAHYAGRHGDTAGNIAKLLAALRDVPDDARGAHFHSTIVLLRSATDPAPLIAEGRWNGRILRAPQGTGGFGYQPIFYDTALGASGADISDAQRNAVSHRGRALMRLREMLAAGEA